MNQKQVAPQTPRGKTVHFIWRNFPRFFLFFLVVLIIFLAATISQKKKSILAEKMAVSTQKKPAVNVVVIPLSPVDIKDRIRLPGYIEPWRQLTLSANVSGIVAKVMVEEGVEVRQDDILAQIETDDYKLALDRARAANKLAVSDYARDRKLFNKGAISPAQLEAKKATVDTTKADMENAELLLSRCFIKAPFDGVINKLHIEQGLFLSIGDPVGELLQIDHVKAVVGIPESDISSIRQLKTVEVNIKALGNKQETGQVHFLASAPETNAALYRLELELNNQSRDILAGMFVSADVVKKTEHNSIAVPFYSIISRNDSHYVFIDENGKALKRIVETGIMEKWMVQVTQGLQPGDRLIVEGHRDIEDGQEIKVVQVIKKMVKK